MTEDNPDQKIQAKRKTYATVDSDRNFSPPRKASCAFTQKNFREFTWHFMSLHTFCEMPTIVPTGYKSVTRFFPNESISNIAVECM